MALPVCIRLWPLIVIQASGFFVAWMRRSCGFPTSMPTCHKNRAHQLCAEFARGALLRLRPVPSCPHLLALNDGHRHTHHEGLKVCHDHACIARCHAQHRSRFILASPLTQPFQPLRSSGGPAQTANSRPTVISRQLQFEARFEYSRCHNSNVAGRVRDAGRTCRSPR